jgi:hypothetical protein
MPMRKKKKKQCCVEELAEPKSGWGRLYKQHVAFSGKQKAGDSLWPWAMGCLPSLSRHQTKRSIDHFAERKRDSCPKRTSLHN